MKGGQCTIAHFILAGSGGGGGGGGGIPPPPQKLKFTPSEITSGTFYSIVLCCVVIALN